MHYNKLIADQIFSKLGLDLSCKKVKRIYKQCIYTDLTAA